VEAVVSGDPWDGDPRNIPDLGFAEFQEFHGKFYHPTNARMWFYGDDDVVGRCRLTLSNPI
jgi:hypothetical protein